MKHLYSALLVLLVMLVLVAPVMAQEGGAGDVLPTPEATATLIEDIGDAVLAETQNTLSGYALVGLGLLFLAVVVIATPALLLLYRSAPPWTQAAFTELAKGSSEQLLVLFDRIEQRARDSAITWDDKMVETIKEVLADKLKEWEAVEKRE